MISVEPAPSLASLRAEIDRLDKRIQDEYLDFFFAELKHLGLTALLVAVGDDLGERLQPERLGARGVEKQPAFVDTPLRLRALACTGRSEKDDVHARPLYPDRRLSEDGPSVSPS